MAQKQVYNLSWNEHEHPAWIELYIWRNYDKALAMGGKLLPRWMHMKNAVQTLFPEKFRVERPGFSFEQRGYIWNKWMEERCKSFCNGDQNRQFQTWWGPSSSGKSTDAGILGLSMWLASPHNTTVLVCSTDKKALEQRIWREIVKYYKLREKELPGQLVRSKTAIYYDQDADMLSGIFGIAVRQGTVDQAVSAIIGRHNTNVYLIIDEMQATLWAAVQAWDNLSSGCEDCGFLGMGNPMNKMDPLGSTSEPIEGWEKLTTEKKEWQTKKGFCLYFDGMESPGVDNPVKYPFLLTQRQIDQMAEDPGEDSPRFWTMRRGFMPPDGIIWSVLNDQMIREFKVKEDCLWESTPVTICGIDPAYSAGGDKCILYPIRVGTRNDGVPTLHFQEPVRIPLVAKEGEHMLKTLRKDIVRELKARGIDIKHTGMDTTGNQWMLADAVEEEMGETGILRVKFTGPATADPISIKDPRPAKDMYQNYVTELWGRMGLFFANNMVRGLCEEACRQFCTRLLDFSTKESRKVVIESKETLRQRLGCSPDEADAASIGGEVVRLVLGILPMESSGSYGGARSADLSYDKLVQFEKNILEDDSFSGDDFAAVEDDSNFYHSDTFNV